MVGGGGGTRPWNPDRAVDEGALQRRRPPDVYSYLHTQEAARFHTSSRADQNPDRNALSDTW